MFIRKVTIRTNPHTEAQNMSINGINSGDCSHVLFAIVSRYVNPAIENNPRDVDNMIRLDFFIVASSFNPNERVGEQNDKRCTT